MFLMSWNSNQLWKKASGGWEFENGYRDGRSKLSSKKRMEGECVE